MVTRSHDSRNNSAAPELERAATHDEIWNAGQRELIETGHMRTLGPRDAQLAL